MSGAAIRLDNVTVAYGRNAAVSGVTGSFAPGSLTAIAGPNGAGKTTLLKALMGEVPPAAGSIHRGTLAPRDFGYLPQLAELDRSFPISVADVVTLGAWRETGALGALSGGVAARARDALANLGLVGFERELIGALSAGQLQRVLFARLLLQDAKVILLDEPFTAIDARTTADLLKIVRHWHQEQRTVIAVLHNFELVRSHFPETLLMARAMLGWGPTASVMSDANLLRARALLEAPEEDAPATVRPLERNAA
jgi:zinc/manganese transport system ATP-binding protein